MKIKGRWSDSKLIHGGKKKKSRGEIIKSTQKGVGKKSLLMILGRKIWFHGSEMQGNHRAALRLTASIHPKEQ